MDSVIPSTAAKFTLILRTLDTAAGWTPGSRLVARESNPGASAQRRSGLRPHRGADAPERPGRAAPLLPEQRHVDDRARVEESTSRADAVTAAVTVPSRGSAAVRVSSARRMSNTNPRAPLWASASTNHVAKLSALTASETVVGTPDAVSPSSASPSSAMAWIWRAARSRVAPAGVGVTGLVRLSSARPTFVSRALIRWATAVRLLAAAPG